MADSKKKNKKFTDERMEEYKSEYTRWFDILSKYHDRFDNNYRLYTAYSETLGTKSKIADPLASEQIERVIQRLFERDPKFIVFARGKNIPQEISNVMSGVLEYDWTSPERVQATGTMRSKLKVWGREFCITGNLGVETFFNNKSNTPDTRIIPIEDIIFDPTKGLKNSDVYYIRQYVTLKYLEDLVEVTEDGKVVGGIFKKDVVEKVKNKYKDTNPSLKDNPDSNRIRRSGEWVSEDPVNNILLISRWEGEKCCRIVDWEGIIQEFDNKILDDDPLDFAMDVEVAKQPYAFSLVDFISQIGHTKDLLLNQVLDYGSKALNPPLFVDPNISPINKRSLANAFKVGGIVFASPQQAGHQVMPQLPSVGFDLLNYLQQRTESVTGIGAYLGGVPNQASDKTQGTKGGIEALISQSVSPVKDRQLNLEESIVEPVANKWLKYEGSLMGANEIKYVFITGEAPKWVKVTGNMLRGKITLNDLITAELISITPDPETGMSEADDIVMSMIESGLDPEKDFIYDVDWVVRVEAGSLAESNTQKELEDFDTTIQAGQAMGIPLDMIKIWKERAMKAGLKEPDQYILKNTQQPIGQPTGQQPMQQPAPPMIGQTPVQLPQ